MLWWKVTLDKTGAILSVEQVAERSKDGKLTCYVEALDKAGACEHAKRWHANYCAKNRARMNRKHAERKAAGACVDCGAVPEEGLARCCRCRERNRINSLRHSRGLSVPLRVTPIEEQRARLTRNSRIAALRKCNLSWRSLAHKFDSLGPEGFRAWLDEKALECEAKVRSAEPQAEAAE
jgi:hypothetical protein